MPSPMNKRRRISEETPASPIKQPPPSHPPVAQNFMTPTKASLAKSYPHLVPKSPARGGAGGTRVVSPTRIPLRRSVAPEGLTEVVEVNGGGPGGRKFMDIENEGEEEEREE